MQVESKGQMDQKEVIVRLYQCHDANKKHDTEEKEKISVNLIRISFSFSRPFV